MGKPGDIMHSLQYPKKELHTRRGWYEACEDSQEAPLVTEI